MNRRTVSTLLLITSSAWSVSGILAAPLMGQTGKQEESKQPKKQESKTALTGCVDEQSGQYVLISDRTRDPIADLVADGFPTEGFAKHVGHTVTIRGISNPDGVRPVFRVRSIETVSDVCGPQHSQGN